MTKPRYTLYYFDSRGRGEPIRLLLTHVGANWVDKGIPGAEWPAIKPQMPLQQMPVLVEHRETGDVKIPHSMAIMRHLARVHGVDGKTEEERLAADLVLETVLDFVGAMSRLRFSPQWEDASAKAKYAAETVPDHLARLERMLGDKSWASGNEPTYADFMAFEILDTHAVYFPNCLADRPKLAAWVARVRALPTLAAYFPTQRKVS